MCFITLCLSEKYYSARLYDITSPNSATAVFSLCHAQEVYIEVYIHV
jgi:hypothetical protein